MQAGYTSQTTFARAAVLTFAAKKASELAPGVGKNTDITIVFRNNCERMREDVAGKLNSLFIEFTPRVHALGNEFVDKFQDYISKPRLGVAPETPKGLPGGDAQLNASASPPAAEASQRQDNAHQVSSS